MGARAPSRRGSHTTPTSCDCWDVSGELAPAVVLGHWCHITLFYSTSCDPTKGSWPLPATGTALLSPQPPSALQGSGSWWLLCSQVATGSKPELLRALEAGSGAEPEVKEACGAPWAWSWHLAVCLGTAGPRVGTCYVAGTLQSTHCNSPSRPRGQVYPNLRVSARLAGFRLGVDMEERATLSVWCSRGGATGRWGAQGPGHTHGGSSPARQCQRSDHSDGGSDGGGGGGSGKVEAVVVGMTKVI